MSEEPVAGDAACSTDKAIKAKNVTTAPKVNDTAAALKVKENDTATKARDSFAPKIKDKDSAVKVKGVEIALEKDTNSNTVAKSNDKQTVDSVV